MDAFEPRPDWARRLLGQGEAPDPRFTLAIETFAGQALQAPLRLWLVGSLMLLSMLLSAGACLRWLRVERALRQRRPLPLPALVPLLALGCLIAALMAAVVLWPRWHA